MAEWSNQIRAENAMACIYILYSQSKNKSYVGSSRKLANERLKNHNTGKVRSTKSGRPWQLVLEENYSTYTEARKREIFLKSGKSREIVKQMIREWSGGVG